MESKHEFDYGYWRKDGPKEEGYSYELISSDSKFITANGGSLDSLVAWPFEGVDTLLKAFRRTANRIPDHPMLGTRAGSKFTWQSWKQVEERAKHISYGMVALNLAPEIAAEDTTYRFIGIQSKNRAEWVIAHLANMHQSITTVAFFDTLGPDAQKFVINQTEMTTMIVSKGYVKGLAQLKKEDTDSGEGKLANLANIVVIETEISSEDRLAVTETGMEIYTLEDVYKKGVEVAGNINTLIEEGKYKEPDSETCSAFSYTSGTTGDPKGVKLTHGMLLQCSYAVMVRAEQKKHGPNVPITEKDCYISYLPAAHSFEQAVMAMAWTAGVSAGFYGGDVLQLVDDIGTLKPTIFPSVPRLYNRIYGKIKDGFAAKPGCIQGIIKNGVATKLANMKAGKGLHHGCYDKLFKKIRMLLGGRVRMMITGSAPIAGDVLDFLKVCFSCPIQEGYGMTETSAGTVITFADDP